MCWRLDNRCCLSRNYFCSSLDVAVTKTFELLINDWLMHVDLRIKLRICSKPKFRGFSHLSDGLRRGIVDRLRCDGEFNYSWLVSWPTVYFQQVVAPGAYYGDRARPIGPYACTDLMPCSDAKKCPDYSPGHQENWQENLGDKI